MVNDETARELREEILDLISRGQKIQAIKNVRALTGGGLKVSKDLVDALAEVVRVPCPCCHSEGSVSAADAARYNLTKRS